ncbi:MAG: hypothetical protein KAQ83_04555 [Nanoarchaeota archaeon]|nr:hypothetical protein [Nanoarchaeota archaeon]
MEIEDEIKRELEEQEKTADSFEDKLENDAISAEEAGFLKGYEEDEYSDEEEC